MRKVILSVICTLFAMGVTAQSAVLPVRDESMKSNPVLGYFLPRTILKVEVEATRTIKKKGPYAAEARRYLGTSAAIQQNEEVWTINEIRVILDSEPDVGNQYKIFASKKSDAILLSLTETGILRGINLPFSSETKEEQQSSTTGEKDKKKERVISPLFVSNYMIKEEYDSLKKSGAATVFDQINTLRETRMNILSQSNEVLHDGSAVKAYLTEIDKKESELMALFNGREQREIVEKTFIVYPDRDMVNQGIFYFSDKQGFSDSGEVIKITLKKRVVSVKALTVDKKKPGFAYRIPALADAEITGDNKLFWKGEFSVAQLGRVTYFPAGMFNKNNVKALFDTKSGALLQIWK